MLGRARIIPVSVFLLTAFLSSIHALPSQAASCPGVPAPSSDGNVFAGVVYDAVGGVMKTCVGSTWVSLGSGGGGGGSSTLATLTDVSTSGIADGKALVYNGTSSKWEPQTISGGGGSSTLATLTDVDTTGIADGKSLVYNATSSKWVPMTVSSGGSGTVSGTTGKIAKFTGAAAVGDSVITESSGKIGIGGTPTFALEVIPGGYNDGIQVKDPTATVYGGLFTEASTMALVTRSNHGLRLGTNDQTRVTITNAGQVGVGMTPTSLLTLNAGTNDGLRINNGTVNGVVFNTSDNSMTVGTVSNHPLNLYTNNTAKVTVLANGNVGIGTTGPANALHVVKDNGGLTLDTATAGTIVPVLQFNTTGTGRASLQYRPDLPGIGLQTGGVGYPANTKFVVTDSGNVGIGTTGPTSNLHINSTGATVLTVSGASSGWINAAISLQATSDTNYRGTGVFMHDLGGQNEWFAGRPYASGDNYIIARRTGVASPSTQTAQTTYALMTLSNAGYLSTSGGGVWSDKRLKTDIEPMTKYGLATILALNPVTYKWKNKPEDTSVHVGLIAQEVETAIPELVHTSAGPDATGNVLSDKKSVDYATLVVPLINAVKELKADNENLRAELKAANDNYEALRHEVDQLKAALH